MEQETQLQQNQTILNTKKLMKELLNNFKFSLPQKGAVLEGEVIGVSLSNVLIDLGPLGSGIVYPKEFYDDPEKQKALKAGQKVKTVLMELENEEGYRELSLRRAQRQSAWQEIKEMYEKGEVLEVTIDNLNKGGLITEIRGIQAFMPLSQLADEHYPKVENGDIQEIVKILQTYKNQKFEVKIIDFDESQNKLIISERAAKAALAQDIAKEFNVGEEVEGEITEVTDFGAFVRLAEGVDALIPKAEISWAKVEDIKEALQAGQKVKAKIIQITPGKIVLSLRALEANPWDKFKEKYQVGQKVSAKVLRLDERGAEVEIEEGLIGFVPAHEFGGKKPEEVLEPDKDYNFAIIEFDVEKRTLILTPEVS